MIFTNFLIAMLVALFCSWHLGNAGYPGTAIAVGALIGLASGIFTAYLDRGETDGQD